VTDKLEHLLVGQVRRTDVVDSENEVADLDPGSLGRAAPSHLHQYIDHPPAVA